jgi:hypothetical protein
MQEMKSYASVVKSKPKVKAEPKLDILPYIPQIDDSISWGDLVCGKGPDKPCKAPLSTEVIVKRCISEIQTIPDISSDEFTDIVFNQFEKENCTNEIRKEVLEHMKQYIHDALLVFRDIKQRQNVETL